MRGGAVRRRVEGFNSPPLTGPATPAALRLALRRRLPETRSAPTPAPPSPRPLVLTNASRRFPSAPGCRSGYVRSEMKVRVFGHTAVVTGSDTEKSSYKGKDTSCKYVWTDVFVQRNGRWQALASQSVKCS